MQDPQDKTPGGTSRRQFLRGGSALGVTALLAGNTSLQARPAPPPDPTPPPLELAEAVYQEVTMTINGQRVTTRVDTRRTLLDLLRHELDLTGTRKGCNHGACGACTVHIDGDSANACLQLAATCDGAEITTIEGLADGEQLHPMQAAFIENDAFQCGYCTSGQIMSAVNLVRAGTAETRPEIREIMSGNLCRCGAYNGIVDAVESVLQTSKK